MPGRVIRRRRKLPCLFIAHGENLQAAEMGTLPFSAGNQFGPLPRMTVID
jgi:hypothetical protein